MATKSNSELRKFIEVGRYKGEWGPMPSEYYWRYYKKSGEHRLYDKSLYPSDTGWTIKRDSSGKYVVTYDLVLNAFGGIPLSKSKKKFSTLEKAKEYCVTQEMR